MTMMPYGWLPSLQVTSMQTSGIPQADVHVGFGRHLVPTTAAFQRLPTVVAGYLMTPDTV
jgi:hypothetical protein